jgi:transcriptional regulator with XRE-family HTH domain
MPLTRRAPLTDDDLGAVRLRVLSVLANIRAEVARQGARQQDLAGAVGLSQQGLSRRLKGHQPLKIDELVAIAEALQVPLLELMDTRRYVVAQSA